MSVTMSAVMCLCVIQPVNAKTAQQKKQEAQQQLNDTNNTIDGLQDDIDDVQGELDDVTTKLSNVMAQIGATETKMEIKESEIDEAQVSLDAAVEKQESQYASMKIRIRYMYENGTQSYLSLLLESKSISELLNRVEYISSVYNYDRDLLEEYEETTKEVAELKSSLEEEMDELVAMQEEYEAQEKELESLKSQLKSQYSDYETKLAQAQSKAETLQAEIEKQNEIIEQEKREAEEKRKAEEEKKKQEAAAAAAAKAAAEEAAKKQAAANSSSTSSSSNHSNGSSSSSSSGSSSSSSSDSSSDSSSNQNPSYKTNISGSDVANYALGFVGYSYVWGASGPNSFDCSGFVYYIYGKHFGVSGMGSRLSAAGYARCGQAVSYANAQPGDLIFYSSGGYIHHVAIYIGGGRIVHAKGKNYGVVTDNATYHTIYSVRRVL
jgi:cell wall-associated NlpC family hydrolase